MEIIDMDQEFLREINDDLKNPRKQREIAEDGFFESEEEVSEKEFLSEWEIFSNIA